MVAKSSYIIIFITVLILAGVIIVKYNAYATKQIAAEAKAALVDDTIYEVKKIEAAIASKIALVKFLHNTPPISGLTRALENNGLDPKDSTTTTQWLNRLAVIFQALIENQPDIKQLRIISVNDKGKEFLRVDRDGGKVVRVPEAFLQHKSQEDYYSAASRLQPNEIHVAPINLNIEHGKIAYPLQPTLRIITPIFFSHRERFGFLIMNIDASSILATFTKNQGIIDSMWLVDADGHFIYHPDPDLQFSKQLHPEATLASEYQLSDIGQSGLLSAIRKNRTPETLIVDRQRVYSGSSFDEHIYLYGIFKKSKLQQKIATRHQEQMILVGLTVGALTIILIIFYRTYSTSLRLNKVNSTYQSIVGSSPNAIIGVNKYGQIKTWNHAATTLFDIPEYIVLNQSLDQCITLNHQDLMAAFISVRTSNISATFTDSWLYKKTGDTKYLEITINPVMDSNNKVDAYTIQVQDRTPEEEAAQQLKSSNTELEEKVQQRTEQLTQYTQQLEIAHQKAMEASQAKSNFISVISHEMRTPLNGMIGTLSLVKRDPLSTNQQRYLNMAEQSISTLSVLINDILDLSKIESEKLEIIHQSFHVGQLLEDMVQSAAIRVKEKNLELVLDLNHLQHNQITTDPNRLKQIINNLLTNATKFTDEGEIMVRASSHNLPEQPEVVRLFIEVIDTGIGIAPENQGKLFQPFTQEDATTSVKYGGTGLGLSICQKLCELMNGDIGFESRQGIGSRFYFSIDMPAKDCQTEALANELTNHHAVPHEIEETTTPNAPDADLSFAGIRILIVEDNKINVEVAKGYLSDLHFEFDVANNGQAAIEILTRATQEGRPFHCILMDCQMPIMNGYDCARQIRFEHSDIGHEKTPIIAMTANAFSGEKEKCLESGMSDYITKPLDQVLLHQKVTQWTRPHAQSNLPTSVSDLPTSGSVNPPAQTVEHHEEPVPSTTLTPAENTETVATEAHSETTLTPARPPSHTTSFETERQQDNKIQQNSDIQQTNEMTWHHELRWDKQQALSRMGGKQALFNKVLRMSKETISEAMSQLAVAIEQQDSAQILHHSHKLKGSYGSIGAARLRQIMSDIENQAMSEGHLREDKIKDYFTFALSEQTFLAQAIEHYLVTLADDTDSKR
ncbi:ATP-binding protein [Vibrio spartinae]|uniref:histidine kinase n=1 Tax=Vibrio spartinae TaxID=1918945 RepID=A0A1N6M716_9VIBR|nr:ATP-binding protein [Vibrio spartinae]QMV13940.1 Aerobic respiration control sensor protein ArcB [Vibrio spartinae]SIO95204.1 Aerobic respiration control sensor protein ArcB [Vibrio spartinae]